MLSKNDIFVNGDDMPAWKKELILRRRSRCNQNVLQNFVPPTAVTVQQPTVTQCSSSVSALGTRGAHSVRCNSITSKVSSATNSAKMVQERSSWIDHNQIITTQTRNDEFDSSEDLKYGPGIVNKLKNRYLHLTLREATTRSRPSILNMRKATSLEHILDDEEDDYENSLENDISNRFEQRDNVHKNTKNRYRNLAKRTDMKRARSVEIISSSEAVEAKPKRESLHEDMLVNRKDTDKQTFEINDSKTFSNDVGLKLNRPKRIAPVMSEKEKPPIDVVKQTKKLFEKPEHRTKPPLHTGEVAAKVATFKEIIETRKPPTKQKPPQPPVTKPKIDTKPSKCIEKNNTGEKITIKKPITPPVIPPLRSPTKINQFSHNLENRSPQKSLPTSPIPDVSNVQLDKEELNGFFSSSLTETPDLIKDSSPKTVVAETNESITEEIKHSKVNGLKTKENVDEIEIKKIPINQNLGNSLGIYDFSAKPKIPNYLPINKPTKTSLPKRSSPATPPKSPPRIKQKTVTVPIMEPLKVEIIAIAEKKPNVIVSSHHPVPKQLSPKHEQPSPKKEEKNADGELQNGTLSDIVIEKNLKNLKTNDNGAGKSVKGECDVVKNVSAPKNKRLERKQEQQNSLVFNFTGRKDVPDYVGNDGRIQTGKIEKPKPGEGGITLLPGATLDESFVDDDDDWMKSLEGPPSPLNVTFVNDNVLINGRSSLSQKTKKPKKSIKFVEEEPNIFEYPSETDLLHDESNSKSATTNSSSLGHSVPSLSGSTLANYTPKSAQQSEEFQLGMKPTQTSTSEKLPENKLNGIADEEFIDETQQPVLFSSGTNSDILF